MNAENLACPVVAQPERQVNPLIREAVVRRRRMEPNAIYDLARPSGALGSEATEGWQSGRLQRS